MGPGRKLCSEGAEHTKLLQTRELSRKFSIHPSYTAIAYVNKKSFVPPLVPIQAQAQKYPFQMIFLKQHFFKKPERRWWYWQFQNQVVVRSVTTISVLWPTLFYRRSLDSVASVLWNPDMGNARLFPLGGAIQSACFSHFTGALCLGSPTQIRIIHRASFSVGGTRCECDIR